MKYIIKNCNGSSKEDRICYPSVKKYISNEDFVSYYCYGQKKPCKDVTDCLLKQIVEKCRLAKQGVGLSMKNFADEILDMLEIEECE